jgi:hypothetical protein
MENGKRICNALAGDIWCGTMNGLEQGRIFSYMVAARTCYCRPMTKASTKFCGKRSADGFPE